MRFRSHQCWFPKDVDFPRDYEDASARSEKHGRAVVADGVSSAIFSRNWARLLTRTAVETPPSLDSDNAIWGWLEPLQRVWRQDIDFNSLKWHQKPKATSVGAQATLLIVHVEPLSDGGEGLGDYRLRASALGDCVLYLVREGRKVFSFPLTQSAEFAQPPEIFSSIAKGVGYAGKFRHLEECCRNGDLLVVCSDAVGLWAMEEYEAGREVDWMRYWENDQAWQEDIQRLRDNRPNDGNRMRVDDCTLLLLQVVAEETFDGEPEMQSDRSDEPFVLLGAQRTLVDANVSADTEATAELSVTDPICAPVVPNGDDGGQTERSQATDAIGEASRGDDTRVVPDETSPVAISLASRVAGGLLEEGESRSSADGQHEAVTNGENLRDRGAVRDEERSQATGFLGQLRRMLAGPSSPSPGGGE